MLGAAAAVVTTSAWTRRLLHADVRAAGRPRARRRARRRCRRARARHRGRRRPALRRGRHPGQGPRSCCWTRSPTIDGLSWHCRCVGSLDRDPAFAKALGRRVRDGGLGDRVCFAGPLTEAELDRSYGAADLLVLASRAETYGMVVTEALARGLPVVAAEVGGVPEALGSRRGRRRARGCSCRRTTRPRWARRCAPGWATPRCAGGCAGRRASGGRRCRDGRPPRRSSPACWRERRDDRRPRSGSAPNGSTCASRPTPAPAPASSSSSFAGISRRPRPLTIHDLGVRHRGDGPVAGAAAAGAAALGAPRPGRRPAAGRRGRPPGPAADGAPSVETRRSDITRLEAGDLAGASLITASALLDLMTGDELAGLIDVCAGGRMSGAAGAVRRRPGRAGPGRSARRPGRGRLRRPPAPDDGGRPAARPGRRRGRRGRVPPARGRGASSGPAPGGSAPPSPPWPRSGWPAGWMPRSSRTPELAAEAAAYARRRLAQARAGRLAVTVGHADLLVLP